MNTENKQKSSNEFEVSVIGAMRSGKSTLINALLGKELMPSKKACTETIVKIKDVDGMDSFSAICRDENENEIKRLDNIDNTILEKINGDWQISSIDIEGDIPFITSKSVQLVLIDTPGPNNSRNEDHQKETYRIIKEKNMSMVLHVLNASQLRIYDDDDNLLLGAVAEAMKRGSKQSKDRFIFVVNQMDDAFDPDRESIEDALNNIRKYLKTHGIHNPNIYPVSAETAKVIRLYQRNPDFLTKKAGVKLKNQCTYFNDYPQLHLSNYAPLSHKNKAVIDKMLNEAKANNDPYAEALVHTGVPALELAINEYIDNYLHPDAVTKTDVPKTELSTMEYIDNNRSSSQMTKFYLKYNPFTVEYFMYINGKEITQNSKLNNWCKEVRLQEWDMGFFRTLISECNDNVIEIDFYGTAQDYDDFFSYTKSFLAYVKTEENKDYNNIILKLNHIEAKTSNERIGDLKKIFELMQQDTPFEELKDEKIKTSFDKALGKEFEIAIVATMSAGKSTLINALLGQELMPSKNDACTAKIVKIKDVDGKEIFSATCTEQDEKTIVCENSKITSSIMNEYNENEKISYINLEGDIPFITSKAVELILIDTPGPNNSQTQAHREHTFRVIKGVGEINLKPIVIYVFNAAQTMTDDDLALLRIVTDSMKEDGKQSRDRFIFVINKIDHLDHEKGETTRACMDTCKEYLKKEGIENPNIFPISAEMAKLIRMKQNNLKMTSNQERFLRNHDLFIEADAKHLSEFAPLSQKNKAIIDKMLNEARANKDSYAEALIHTGVPALELVINEYLEKYALPVKIKMAVQTFIKIIESKRFESQLKEQIQKDEEKRKKLKLTLEKMQSQVRDGEKAANYRKLISELKLEKDVINSLKSIGDKIFKGFPTDPNDGKQISIHEADSFIKKFDNHVAILESDIKTALEIILQNVIINNASALINSYKDSIINLIEDGIVTDKQFSFDSDAITCLTVNIPDANTIVNSFKYKKEVKVCDKEIDNPEREGFIGFFKIWEPKKILRPVYENKEFISFTKIFDHYVKPTFMEYLESLKSTQIKILDEAERFKSFFIDSLDELDNEIKNKIDEYKKLSSDNDFLNKSIEDNKIKDNWLKQFMHNLNSKLEI